MNNFLTFLTAVPTQITLESQSTGLWDQILDFFYEYSFIILIATVVILLLVQSNVKNKAVKYSKVSLTLGYTGADVARKILDANGIYDVEVRQIQGSLTDNYNPGTKVVSLSEPVYGKSTITAAAIAAHEVGHAIQHNQSYVGLKFRQVAYHFARFTSGFTGFLLIFSLITGALGLFYLGIIGLVFALLFQVATLPVEFNASKRALVQLEDLNIVTTEEIGGAKSVLSAAAMTYLAAVLSTLVYILRLLAVANRR